MPGLIQPPVFALLIPCYKNEDGLIRSLKSVKFNPDLFILVIVDDGNLIPLSAESIEKQSKIGCQINIVRNPVNIGITKSLNRGLEWIQQYTQVKYIARLDCGDICTEERFNKQTQFLDAHPDTGLLGSWCIFNNANTKQRYYFKTATRHKAILRSMYTSNVFIHPTVMFRVNLLGNSGHYPEGFDFAEDYAFFWQLVKLASSHILPDFLVVTEVNPEGISLKNRQKQLASCIRVIMKFGTSPLLKLTGLIRFSLLRLLPGWLILHVKYAVKRQ